MKHPACVALALAAAGPCLHSTAVAAPAAATEAAAADMQAVRAFEAEVFAAYNRDDADEAASHYADDAFVFIPDLPPARGRAMVAANIRQFMADPNFRLGYQNQQLHVSDDGSMAYARGRLDVTYTDRTTKAARTTSSNYLLVMRKDPTAGWQIVEDVSF